MTDAPLDRAQILIADDQADVLDALRLLLRPEGFATQAARSPAAVVAALRQREFDLLLMDLNYARDTTSGREGLDLLSKVHAIDERIPIVVMTGWGSMDIAIEALRAGVRDFVQKPWDNDRVIALVRGLSDERRRERREAGRQSREMREARDIQQALLPRHLPAVEGWGFAARCDPAALIGGDTYDLIALPDDGLGIAIADVAGKGIPAALLASSLQTAVRSAAPRHAHPSELCGEVNQALCHRIPDNRFITFFYGRLDTRTGRLRYVNAGHNPPLLARCDGSASWLEVGGVVLGIEESAGWTQGEVTLQPGDRLLLYTDGIVEARDAGDEEFGTERLHAVANKTLGNTAPATLETLFRSLRSFSGPQQDDDQTAVVIERGVRPN